MKTKSNFIYIICLYVHDLNGCLRHSIQLVVVVFPIVIAAVEEDQ